MNHTTHYSLKKPEDTDIADIDDFNFNADKIDEELKKVNTNVSNLSSQLDIIKKYGQKYINVNMFTTLRSAVESAKLNNLALYIPNAITVNETINITGIKIFGNGIESSSKIKLGNEQINLFESKGNTTIEDITLDGGWNGVTTLQKGDVLNVYANREFTSRITLKNVNILNAKHNAITFNKVGYSTFDNVKVNACGNNALELYKSTSLITTGSCVFSDCPNGYSISLEDCHNISFNGDILEYTKGIIVKGLENRALNFNSVYEECISTGKYITIDGSGIGLNIIGCFGGGTSIDYNLNYLGVNIFNCTNLTVPEYCVNWGIVQTNTNAFDIQQLSTDVFKVRTNSYMNPIRIKDYNFWIDPNTNLRIKQNAPTSDYDGNIIPKWVDIPSSPLSPGIEGQMAKDSAYLYICTSNGNWTRIALTSW